MTSIGWATMSIIPSFSGFGTALDRGTAPALAKAGKSGGSAFGDAFTRDADRKLRDSNGRFVKNAGSAGSDSGEAFGDGFSRDVNGKLRDANGRFVKDSSAAGGKAGTAAGRAFNSDFAKNLKRGAIVGGLAAAYGIGSFIKDSVLLESQYSKTMAQMRVATKAPADELQRLDDLAIQLGKETVFSAVDASDAMLELAKNGIKPATIEAGALSSALTLAAAGGTGLEESAKVMGNTLNAFRLKGDKAASVAAALAGAANASSASVGSLAQGLQQSSASAADAGLNVQETTGILAAFANAGIDGSDAGTSLKTMLTRLIPSTRKASNAMKDYGLKFTDANGEFNSALEIAENLKQGLGELSAEERSAALNTIFGSDARRAATILTREGADGLAKYIKATSDQGAAEEMAAANMEGTAGAIERLKGAWETAKLELGKEIAPVAADFLDYLSENIDDLAPKLVTFGAWFRDDGVPKIKQFADFVRDDVLPVLSDLGEFAKDAAGFAGDLGGALDKLPDGVKLGALNAALVGGGALKLRGGGGALGGAGQALGLAKPVNVFVTNPGFGKGGAGAGGATGGGLFGKAAGAAMILSFAIPFIDELSKKTSLDEVLDGKPTRDFIKENFGNKNTTADSPWASIYEGDAKDVSAKIDAAMDASRAKAAGLGRELDLVGARKITPRINNQSINESKDALARFVGLQIEAGRPVTPYINTTSIERAIQQIRTLNAEMAGNVDPTRGVDNGVPFASGGGGGTGGTNGTVGRATIGTVNIQAHDYNDFLAQTQRRVQSTGLGGF